jgi:hypothetical protein
MAEPKFTVGQRVAFAVNATTPIEGYVRAILSEFGVYYYRIARDTAPQRQRWTWHREDRLKPAVTSGHVYRRCSDIPDHVFLAAIDTVVRQRSDPGYVIISSASQWDIATVLAGHPELVGTGHATQDWPGVPPRLLLAKAKRLCLRRLIDGCFCGCRGDFEVTAKGREYQRSHARQDDT